MPIGTEANEEVVEVLGELRDGFAEFKAASEAKLEAMKIELKKFEAKSNRERLGFGGTGEGAVERTHSVMTSEQKAGLDRYIRTGEIERKVMTVANDAQGGYLAPPQLSAEVAQVGAEEGAIRKLARGFTARTGDFHIPILTTLATAAWVGESGTRANTATPGVAKLHPSNGAIYAVAPISNQLLADSSYDVAALIVESIGQQFGASEGAAFVNGDTINKPSGFLTQAQAETADATRPFFTVEKMKSGSLSAITIENLVNLRGKLAPRYRKNAAWVMHPSTEDYLRTLRVSTDGPLAWVPSLDGASPNRLLGNEVHLDVSMPEIGAGAVPLVIADWSKFYVTVDIGDMMLIRDNVTSKGQTLFYVEKRVGGAVLDSNAGKLLIMATP